MNKKLRGSTMVELMVVIIIAGVIFTIVIDGLGLFQRYTNSIAMRITDNGRFYDSYYRLENIVASADSILFDGHKVRCYSNGIEKTVLSKPDSLLVAEHHGMSDTLMNRVDILTVVPLKIHEPIDSVKISVFCGDDRPLTIVFPVVKQKHILYRQLLTDAEKQYEYDEP